MNNKLYEALKWVALIVLPALAVFYATLAGEWHWSNTDHIIATIVSIDTLLGVVLKLKPAEDGVAYITPGADLDDPNKFVLDLNGDPAQLENQKVVRLKVKPRSQRAT